MQLVRPAPEYLTGYISALERGWSPDNVRGAIAAHEELAKIKADASDFLANLDDREAKGPPVVLPDGSVVARIPGYRRWLWDGEFAGSIGFWWQPGTTALPPHCLGHIGYAVVPWKQRQGYATRALQALLIEAKAEGLPYVEITADIENIASQRVILRNGGMFIEQFTKPLQLGSTPSLRYRIALA